MADQDEGVRIMVRALRFCQEYMLEHNCKVDIWYGKCQCKTCKKVRELYCDLGGDDNLYVLKAKYF